MVLADGCFDPLHIGHIRYLSDAKSAVKERESFIVRVAPDSAIIEKGRKVFQTLDERAHCISLIVPGVECSTYYDTLAEAINILRPRLLVKGVDWYGRLPGDVMKACEAAGTAVMFTLTQERTSTERLG